MISFVQTRAIPLDHEIVTSMMITCTNLRHILSIFFISHVTSYTKLQGRYVANTYLICFSPQQQEDFSITCLLFQHNFNHVKGKKRHKILIQIIVCQKKKRKQMKAFWVSFQRFSWDTNDLASYRILFHLLMS